jgi:hypothetical protein
MCHVQSTAVCGQSVRDPDISKEQCRVATGMPLSSEFGTLTVKKVKTWH